ncbi:DNA polymerase zeta processivity subunit, partial [Neolecta irregularis DAH-3]
DHIDNFKVTVALHTILHSRNIYPAELFIRARKYNSHVQQCRHPTLCQWIRDAVQCCTEELEKGTVSRISIVILSTADIPFERFIFDVSGFPDLPQNQFDIPIENAKMSPFDLEEQYRAAIVRLGVCEATLGTLPEDCTFTITIELRQKANYPHSSTSWLPESQRNVGTSYSQDVTTIPLRSVTFGDAIPFELWIEESVAKSKLKASK